MTLDGRGLEWWMARARREPDGAMDCGSFPPPTPAHTIVRFHDDDAETAPAWMGSIMAAKHGEDSVLMDQAAVLVAAHRQHEAEDKALNMALRYWKLADGWSHHAVVVSHLQSALDDWFAPCLAPTVPPLKGS